MKNSGKLIPFGTKEGRMITQGELYLLREKVKLIHEQCVREEYWEQVQKEELEKAYSTGVEMHIPDRDNTRQGEDEEAILNRMVDKQDQMAPIWDMIQEMYRAKNMLFVRYAHHKAAFQAEMARLNLVKAKFEHMDPKLKSQKAKAFHQWQRKLWDRANPMRAKRDAAWAAIDDMLEENSFYRYRLNLLWTIWKQMNQESKEIVGNRTYLWPKYFELKEGALDPRHITSDSEEIDNQVDLIDRGAEDLAYWMSWKAEQQQGLRDIPEVTGTYWKQKAWEWAHKDDPRVQGISLNPKTLKPYSSDEELAQFLDEMDSWTYQDEDMPPLRGVI